MVGGRFGEFGGAFVGGDGGLGNGKDEEERGLCQSWRVGTRGVRGSRV